MSLHALAAPRFIRKTELGQNEYHRAFYQLDNDIRDTVSSPEADEVTPLMSKIYLRLTSLPAKYWERYGVIRIRGEEREGEWYNSWLILCDWLNVASATANKAIDWLQEQGVIGYHARKNGVGIRIFLNRATNSIGQRPGSANTPQEAHKPVSVPVRKSQTTAPGQKILFFAPASPAETPASSLETPLKDVNLDTTLDVDIDPHTTFTPQSASPDSANTPDGGITEPASIQNPTVPETTDATGQETKETAQNTPVTKNTPQDTEKAAGKVTPLAANNPTADKPNNAAATTVNPSQIIIQANLLPERIAAMLRGELNRDIEDKIRQALTREMERTRQWWEERALPKAIRVAQRESYQILRQHDNLKEREQQTRDTLAVGGHQKPNNAVANVTPHPPLSETQITDFAELCTTQYEFHSQPLGVTLNCLTDTRYNGYLQPADAAKVRREALRLLGMEELI